MSDICKRKRRYAGFSLVEAILANVILCGAVVALGSVSNSCLKDVVINDLHSKAASLAQRKLLMIEYMGIEAFMEADDLAGKIEQGSDTFSYNIAVEKLEINNLYSVAIKIGFTRGSRNYEVNAQTRFFSSSQQLGI